MKSFKRQRTVTENSVADSDATPSNGSTGNKGMRDPASNGLPDRYAVKQQGDEKVLTCLEAPNLSVRIKSDLVFSASAARKSPAGTIFLDGAAQGEPFLDHEKQIYNLDHHEGCVRPFTLATCEQAMVVVMRGLDLREREWNIFANDPDLDTVLAIWVLFNHLRISEKEATIRRLLIPLVRVEGTIDALGLELKEFCGLPRDLMRKMDRKIEHLRSEEVGIKKEGRWQEIDFLDYTASVLRKIDRMLYQSRDFADFKGVEELARVDLTENRFAVIIEADMGIYEVESRLQKLYGNRLGVAGLRRSPNTYTLRQMDLFMPGSLDDVYDRLNYLDPAVKFPNEENRWGGAADIGGSPRMTGTQLTPQEIAHACRDAFQRLSLLHHFVRFLLTAAVLTVALALNKLVLSNGRAGEWFGVDPAVPLFQIPGFGLTLFPTLLTLVVLAIVAGRKPWQYGLNLPTGSDWWLALPLAVLGGLAGGTWVLEGLDATIGTYGRLLFIIFVVPLSSELLFRSVVHGILARGTRIQHVGGRWFISWPNAGAAVIYGGVSALFACSHQALFKLPWPHLGVVETMCGAFIFGIAAGLARERSHSVLGAYFFHVVTVACVKVAAMFL